MQACGHTVAPHSVLRPSFQYSAGSRGVAPRRGRQDLAIEAAVPALLQGHAAAEAAGSAAAPQLAELLALLACGGGPVVVTLP